MPHRAVGRGPSRQRALPGGRKAPSQPSVTPPGAGSKPGLPL